MASSVIYGCSCCCCCCCFNASPQFRLESNLLPLLGIYCVAMIRYMPEFSFIFILRFSFFILHRSFFWFTWLDSFVDGMRSNGEWALFRPLIFVSWFSSSSPLSSTCNPRSKYARGTVSQMHFRFQTNPSPSILPLHFRLIGQHLWHAAPPIPRAHPQNIM